MPQTVITAATNKVKNGMQIIMEMRRINFCKQDVKLAAPFGEVAVVVSLSILPNLLARKSLSTLAVGNKNERDCK